MDFWVIVVVCIAGFAVNFFSVVTGGAGLVLTPLLIAFGYPPAGAIAATRFSYLGSSITGTIEFHRRKQIDYKLAIPLSIFGVIGAVIGAFLVVSFEPTILRYSVGFMILFILAIMLIYKDFGEEDRQIVVSVPRLFLGGLFVCLAVILGTLAGGGLIVLISYVLVLVFKESFLHSAGTQKIINDLCFLLQAGIFMYLGLVDYYVAVPLLVVSSAGGWLGSSYNITKGAHWVKKIFIAVIIILAIRMIISF